MIPDPIQPLVQQYGTTSILFVILSAGVALVSRQMGPRQIRAFEALRGLAFRRLHPLGGRLGRLIPPRGEPRALTRQKSDDEYALTAEASVMRLYRVLLDAGAAYNPTSTKKYRMAERRGEHRKQYSVGTFAFRDSLFSQRQLHLYLFPNSDGSVDIYAHEEDSAISDPEGHVDSDDTIKGDPDGKLRRVLEDAGVTVSDGSE